MRDKRTRAVSNVGFQLVPAKKEGLPEFAPVKTLTEKEMKELGYKVKEHDKS